MSKHDVIELQTERTANALTPMDMIDRALTNNADVETLSKLMDLQERYQSREAKASYDADMAAMQAELPVIEKTRTGHGWKYADWGDIKRQINPVLTKYGFAITHRTEAREKDMIVTAICSHREGHREETSLPLPYDTSGSKNDVQARGSTVQYGIRYTGTAIIGVAIGGEERDGARPGNGGLTPEEEAHDLFSMIEAQQNLQASGFKEKLQEECRKKKLSPAAFRLVNARYAQALRDEQESYKQ